MSSIDYQPFDADNHYYEALDAFTRHLDPKLGPRTVQWCEIEGKSYHVVGGRVSHAVANPSFNPIAKPGALYDYLRGNQGGKSPIELLRAREPIPAHYHEPGARVSVMDEQGIEACWLFPTLGILYEELLVDDTEAVTLTFTAFNRWLDEDWGLDYHGRIFAAPYVSLCDLDWACAELEWALSRGARVIVMRPAAAFTALGPRSPSDPCFDPFWARVNEAGITVVVHAGDSGYTAHGYARDGFGSDFGSGGGGRPSVKGFNIERAAHDFLVTLLFDKLFERFPNLRVASVENGAEYLADLFRKLRSTAARMPGYFAEDPVDTFRRHVWINPFWEDDVNEVVEQMGPERVIFGSDWPHIEGLPQPLDYLDQLSRFDDKTRQLILRDNARELNTLRPAAS